MRKLGKHSMIIDLETEIYNLYRELMEDHSMNLDEAKEYLMIADQRAHEYIKQGGPKY